MPFQMMIHTSAGAVAKQATSKPFAKKSQFEAVKPGKQILHVLLHLSQRRAITVSIMKFEWLQNCMFVFKGVYWFMEC